MKTPRQLIVDPPDGIIIVGSTDSLVTKPPEFGASLQRVLIASGALDAAFGSNGRLIVPLRSDKRPGDKEHQTAWPLVDQGGGGIRVPVFFEGNEDDVVLEQLKELTLAWIEIT